MFRNKIIPTQAVTNLDILRYKVESMYFTNVNDVIEDVKFMFNHINQNIPSLFMKEFFDENLSRAYLSNIFVKMIKMLLEIKKEYKMLFDNDIKVIIENNKLPKCSKYYLNQIRLHF